MKAFKHESVLGAPHGANNRQSKKPEGKKEAGEGDGWGNKGFVKFFCKQSSLIVGRTKGRILK